MQVRLLWGLKNLVKRLPWGEKPGYRHQKHLCEWFWRKFCMFLTWHMRIDSLSPGSYSAILMIAHKVVKTVVIHVTYILQSLLLSESCSLVIPGRKLHLLGLVQSISNHFLIYYIRLAHYRTEFNWFWLFNLTKSKRWRMIDNDDCLIYWQYTS